MKFYLFILLFAFLPLKAQTDSDSLRKYYDTTKWEMPYEKFVKWYKFYKSLEPPDYIEYEKFIKFANKLEWFDKNYYSYGMGRGCFQGALRDTSANLDCLFFDYKKYYGMKFKDAIEAIRKDYNLVEPIRNEGYTRMMVHQDGIILLFSYKYDDRYIAELEVNFESDCRNNKVLIETEIDNLYNCTEYGIDAYLVDYQLVLRQTKVRLPKGKTLSKEDKVVKKRLEKEIMRIEELFEKK